MRRKKKKMTPEQRAAIVASARAGREKRSAGYRDRALALFPHVCGRCGREFTGSDLRELTVHHKDHNHDNNPPDGSNWELLCLYCHDNEHQDPEQRGHYDASKMGIARDDALGFNAFEGLKDLLPPTGDDEGSAGVPPASGEA